MLSIDEKVKALRALMEEKGYDAYLVTGTDPHMSEYVAPRWRTRAFISGFTGSAGTVLVTKTEAILWVDSRYFIQAAAEIKGTCFRMIKLDIDDNPDAYKYIEDNMANGSCVATEECGINIESFNTLKKRFAKKGISFVASEDLLDKIWDDRPAIPNSTLRSVPLGYCGLDSCDKLKKVREELKKRGADNTFISSIDDIAWLTNLRGDDIKCNPVFMAFAYISMDKAYLFTSPSRFTDEVRAICEKDFIIKPYESAYTDLKDLISGVSYYNPERVNMAFSSLLDKEESIKGRDITTDLKAKKNEIELRGMRRSHLMDGVAFINFLSKLNTTPDGSLDEIAVSTLLEKERERREGYLGPSFNPISGFKEHGAMCHYSATPESSKKIDSDGLLVLDTGSQFYYGMTDITRTLCFGTPTAEQKKDYTLVLKGHLALARQIFYKGTKGYQLDVLAKQYMWQAGMTFYHGTGHGVGFNLNVHEGPMNISGKPIDVALEKGMIVSDEPGIYKEGRHGIRIENLIAVDDYIETEFGQFLAFEVLTMVPYEKKLIDLKYLDDSEIQQINAYHQWIKEELIGLVDESAKAYLESATSPLERE